MLLKKYYKIAGFGLLLITLGYITEIRFLQKKLQSINARNANTSELLQSKNQEASVYKKEQYQAKLKQWSCEFSSGDILNALEKAAIDAQVVLDVLEPQAGDENEFFIISSIKLDLSGQYKNLLGFINNVFKQPFFVALDELTIQKKVDHDVNDELRMLVLLRVYRSKVLITENIDSKLVPISDVVIHSFSKDVFAKSIGTANLFLWASKELSFLGMIKQGQNIYGFVSDPMGVTHQVTVGDKVGLKQRRIIAINEHGIITTNKADNIYQRN